LQGIYPVQRHFGAFGGGEIDWRGGGRAPRLGALAPS
jgi:hypothetical protein